MFESSNEESRVTNMNLALGGKQNVDYDWRGEARQSNGSLSNESLGACAWFEVHMRPTDSSLRG